MRRPATPRPGEPVTAQDIRSYGACRKHRAWRLLCCTKLCERIDGKWFWRGGFDANRATTGDNDGPPPSLVAAHG